MPSVLTKPVPHKEAAKFIADKPVVSRQVFDQLLPDIKARAFTITGIEDANVVQGVRDRIAEIPQGADWDQVKIEIADKISPWLDEERAAKRAEMLIRTHGFQSYAVANEAIGERQRAAFPYAQYVTMDDDAVRESHEALNGLVLPADSPFWDTHTGPWDWGCRCSKVYLTEDDVKDLQAADADKKPEEQRVLDAERLRELENSGMLTRALPGDGGLPRRYNVARVEREGAYTFNPSTLQMDAAQLSQRYDPEVWKGFENYASNAKLDDGRTVLDWLNSAPPAPRVAPQPRIVPPPAPAAIEKPAPAPAPTPAAAPAKAPVSKALDVRTTGPHKPQMRIAINAVDQVHDDGALPQVAVIGRVGSKYALGEYHQGNPFRGIGPQIGIRNAPASWPGMTTVHEIGHLLDHQVLGTPGIFASEFHHTFAAFRAVVAETQSFKAIAALGPLQRGQFATGKELWARAYAQYIATRSRDPLLLSQLDRIRSSSQPWRQWSDEDFKPVAAAIDDILKAKGWRP